MTGRTDGKVKKVETTWGQIGRSKGGGGPAGKKEILLDVFASHGPPIANAGPPSPSIATTKVVLLVQPRGPVRLLPFVHDRGERLIEKGRRQAGCVQYLKKYTGANRRGLWRCCINFFV